MRVVFFLSSFFTFIPCYQNLLCIFHILPHKPGNQHILLSSYKIRYYFVDVKCAKYKIEMKTDVSAILNGNHVACGIFEGEAIDWKQFFTHTHLIRFVV